MKILVIRFSSIGDIILCTPIIRACKKQLNAEVHFLTKKRFATLLANNPHLDQIHSFKEKISELKSTLVAEDYDYVVDLHKNIRSMQVRSWLKKTSSHFNKLNIRKWLYVNFKVDRLPPLHIVDRYFEACPMVKDDGAGLDYFIREENKVDLQVGSYTCLILGATYYTKRIPLKILEDIISQSDVTFVLIGGPEEKELGEQLESKFPNAINACGLYSIDQSASIIDQSETVIASDTGMMHIAAALKKHILMVWGNTVPAFGMGPFRTEVDHFEITDLSCRPCSKLGKDKCPKGHFKCMLEQDVPAIVKKLSTR